MKKLLFALIFTFSIFNSQLSIATIARGVGPATNLVQPSTTCTMTLNGTTTGRMLVIGIAYSTFGSPVRGTVTVSGESNATVVAGSFATNAAITQSSEIAYLAKITAGGNKTVTVNFAPAAYASCGVMEYSGQDDTSQPDASGTQSNNDASGVTSCASSITTAANSLIVALCTNNGASSITAGSGYTSWGAFPDSGFYNDVMDKVDAGTAGSETVNFTGPFNQAMMSTVAFKIAGGGGGGPAPNVTVRRRVQ